VPSTSETAATESCASSAEACRPSGTRRWGVAAPIAAAGSVGILGAPIASADDPSTTTIGSQAKLVGGNVIQGWTITGLKTSSDAIPYPVAGTLWEATATDEALCKVAPPRSCRTSMRAPGAARPTGRCSASQPRRASARPRSRRVKKTTGKVYFDVTDDTPDSVVYNAGGQDLLVWVQPPPQPRQSGGSYSGGTRGQGSAAPAATTPAAPAAAGSPAAATGTEGTPLPAGAPLPSGSSGTPLPAGAAGTPAPAGTSAAPVPAGSQGTPVAPTTTVVAPQPPA
jgi:hypothetical protein